MGDDLRDVVVDQEKKFRDEQRSILYGGVDVLRTVVALSNIGSLQLE